jgi:hypothetical protein
MKITGKEVMKTIVVYFKVGLLFLDVSRGNEEIAKNSNRVVRFVVTVIFALIMRPSHQLSPTHAHTL